MGKKFILLILLLFPVTGALGQLNFSESVRKNYFRDSVERQLKAAKEDTAKVLMLISLGDFYIFRNADSAVSYYEQSYKISKTIKYKYGETWSLIELCGALTILGDYSDALNFGLKSLALSENLKNESTHEYANFQVMLCYYEQEDYAEALKYAAKAKILARYSKLPLSLQSVVVGHIGSVYERVNQLDSALYYEYKAFRISTQFSGNYLHIGQTYFKKKLIDSALYYYRKGIQVSAELGIYIDIVDIYYELSRIFESQAKIDSAIYYARKSIEQKAALTYPQGQLRGAKQLAHLYELTGSRDSVIKYLKLSTSLNERMFSKEKTRKAQSFAFNEEIQRQEFLARQVANEAKIKMYGLIVIIVVFLLVGFLLYRNKQIRSEAFIQNQLKDLEMKALKAQMNPHFIYNALNSIQALVASDKKAEGIHYIGSFSRLLRQVLDYSENNIISLDKELETIGLYIGLESLRLNMELNYEKFIPEDIVAEFERIPPLILQPFIENALWHGLSRKSGDKTIKITISLDSDWLICNIIDNGIGRAKANELKTGDQAMHQSKGIEITRKRLIDYNETSSVMPIEFIDHRDNDDQAAGTQVIVRVKRKFAP